MHDQSQLTTHPITGCGHIRTSLMLSQQRMYAAAGAEGTMKLRMEVA